MSIAGIDVGAQAPERVFGPLTRTDFVRYAGASGDFHPLHHDDDFVRAAGFPSVFAMGMLPAALMATQATDWLGLHRLRRLKFRFREQVWLADEVTCCAVVRAVDEADEGTRVLLELSCVRQTGAVAVTGEAEFFQAATDHGEG